MKKLTRIDMKKISGGLLAPPEEGTSKCCVTNPDGTEECTACVHDGGIDCSAQATRIRCSS